MSLGNHPKFIKRKKKKKKKTSPNIVGPTILVALDPRRYKYEGGHQKAN